MIVMTEAVEDGKPHPVTGSPPDYDAHAATRVDAYTRNASFMKAGKVVRTGILVVSLPGWQILHTNRHGHRRERTTDQQHCRRRQAVGHGTCLLAAGRPKGSSSLRDCQCRNRAKSGGADPVAGLPRTRPAYLSKRTAMARCLCPLVDLKASSLSPYL